MLTESFVIHSHFKSLPLHGNEASTIAKLNYLQYIEHNRLHFRLLYEYMHQLWPQMVLPNDHISYCRHCLRNIVLNFYAKVFWVYICVASVSRASTVSDRNLTGCNQPTPTQKQKTSARQYSSINEWSFVFMLFEITSKLLHDILIYLN